MLVHPVQQQLETFGRIAEAAQRESTAGQRSAGQGTPQRFRTQGRLRTGLQLGEEFLREGERLRLEMHKCLPLFSSVIWGTETHNNRIDAGHVLVVLLVDTFSLHAVDDLVVGGRGRQRSRRRILIQAVAGTTQPIWTVAIDITIWEEKLLLLLQLLLLLVVVRSVLSADANQASSLAVDGISRGCFW